MLNPELRNELEKRFNKDQHLSRHRAWEELKTISHENAKWLKKVIQEQGWPAAEKVGSQGELHAWLIIQHAEDLAFQKSCLELMKKLPSTKERKQHIAYLTDRILVSENKAQLYGTQYSYGKLLPIDDEKNVETRRKTMELEPLAEYKKRMIGL